MGIIDLSADLEKLQIMREIWSQLIIHFTNKFENLLPESGNTESRQLM